MARSLPSDDCPPAHLVRPNRHPATYTPNSEPYTLHPTPYTRHPQTNRKPQTDTRIRKPETPTLVGRILKQKPIPMGEVTITFRSAHKSTFKIIEISRGKAPIPPQEAVTVKTIDISQASRGKL